MTLKVTYSLPSSTKIPVKVYDSIGESRVEHKNRLVPSLIIC